MYEYCTYTCTIFVASFARHQHCDVSHDTYSRITLLIGSSRDYNQARKGGSWRTECEEWSAKNARAHIYIRLNARTCSYLILDLIIIPTCHFDWPKKITAVRTFERSTCSRLPTFRIESRPQWNKERKSHTMYHTWYYYYSCTCDIYQDLRLNSRQICVAAVLALTAFIIIITVSYTHLTLPTKA